MPAGALQTRARLVFRHDDDRGRTFLQHRRAGGLCHVGKPYWDGSTLTLQLVNPTAGIFAGDDLALDVELGERARVALESPSATRFHTMDARGHARLSQSFSLAAGASLDFRPDWTIPQAGSEVSQSTRLDLHPASRLAFVDLVAPGRVAHGESHRYRRFQSGLSLRIGDRLVARERMELRPDLNGWPLSAPGWDNAFYAALWLVDPHLDPEAIDRCSRTLAASLHSGDLRFGATCLEQGVYVFRILSARALLVRGALTKLRSALAPVAPVLSARSRRL